MGGDHGPGVIVPAAARILKQFPDVCLILVGQEDALLSNLKKIGLQPNAHLQIRHASEVVEMDEAPALALRKKKDSSMRVAINLVHEGKADAIVSAGNTGALMATAKFVLKTLPGIDRPAIMTTLPSITGHTHMLDLGANVDCSAGHLLQFAVMGSVAASAVDNMEKPRVGLLNIGTEELKGNAQVKEADQLLRNSNLNYIGYVEGDDIYKGTADVVVCDGFVGNIALKSTEGVAKMITYFMRQEFKRNIITRLAGLVALPVLRAFRKRVDPRVYNGASLLGLQHIVIKSHGSADVFSFANAIKIALLEVEKALPQRISKHIETLLEKEPV
ncbi:MAG: phosphate acyltransferase [Pseudomonadota bacterium]|nr:phosphate acyltransferase [Pseudomonadota bacterium]